MLSWLNNFNHVFLLAMLTFWASTPAVATEMVYTPINPSFGGNPNNAPGLMSIAQSQNSFTAPTLSPIENFNLSLQRAILSRLTSQTLTTMFGSDNTLSPTVNDIQTVGYTIKITDNGDNTLTIQTTEKNSGATASFIINEAPK